MRIRLAIVALVILAPCFLTAQLTYDSYGGFSDITAPGCAGGYFTQQVINNQATFVDPLCHPFGGILVDLSSYGTYQIPDNSTSPSTTGYAVISAKYGSGNPLAAWASHLGAIAAHYGFTGWGDYNDTVSIEGYHSTNQLPKFVFVKPEGDAMYHPSNCGSYTYPVKDFYSSINYSVFTTITYKPYLLDVEDPILAACTTWEFTGSGGIVSALAGQGVTLNTDPWTIAISLGDMDDTDSFRGDGTGQQFPHLGMLAATVNPQGQCPTCSNGQGGTGSTFWSKSVWITYLQGKYGSVAAVNTAWSTGGFYTCWGPSTWGTGTCVADEDGRHSWFGGPTADAYSLTGVNANLVIDLNHMLYQLAYDYAHAMVAGATTYDSGHHLITVGNFFGSPRQASGTSIRTQVLDGFRDAGVNFFHVLYQTYINNSAMIKLVHDETGKPVVIWDSSSANCDSPLKSFDSNCPTGDGYNDKATQPARAVQYGGDLGVAQGLTGTDGTNYAEGVEVWGQTDYPPAIGMADGWAVGFLTTLQDNPLDGVCNATGIHTDAVGQPCGNEPGNYGDFLDGAATANSTFLTNLHTALSGGSNNKGKFSGASVSGVTVN